MLKTFKKSIALFVAIVFVMSLVPFGVMASTEADMQTATLQFLNVATSRSKSSSGHQNLTGSYFVRMSSKGENSNDRRGYTQLDFSGYEEILGNNSTTVAAVYREGRNETNPCTNYYITAYPGHLGDYDPTTVTFADAKALGLHSDTAGTLIYEKTSTSAATGVKKTIDVDLGSLNAVLAQYTDSSVVTLTFTSSSSSSYIALNPNVGAGYEDIGVHISYDANEIDNQAYVDGLVDGIATIDDLVGEAGLEAGLPLKYYGADITWQSSDPDYISNDGKVTQHIESKDVTLTATFSYKGADANATLATATKEFVVTVEGETPVEVTIPFTNYAYSRSSATNTDNAKNIAYKRQTHAETTVQSIVTGGSYDAYTQLDLKGYEEILKNPHTSIQMKLTAGFRFSTARLHNVEGVLAPDKADSYNWETVTWNIAEDIGLHETEGRPVLFTKNDDKRTPNGSTVTVDADKEALLSALSENDTNSVVSIHFNPLDWNGAVEPEQNYYDSSIRANNANTCLVITYYPSEVDNDAFYADIEETFAWETITSDAQTAVVNNLPTYYKGADVVWSSAEGYVTSSGELAIPSDSAMAEDTITANVSYNGNTFTKEFAVKLCDGSLTVGTPELTVDGGIATGSISATNATGADAVYQLYLAVYSDKEMINLVPVTLTAAKGETTSETVTANVAEGNKVKFLVWEYGKTTPSTVAVEK